MLDIKRLRKNIKENETYLNALEELDRIGKLRKTTYKERVNFTIDADLMLRFSEYCRKNNYKKRRIVESLIRKLLQ